MTGSWVPGSDAGDFPLANLPYGVFDDGKGSRPAVAIGDHVLDLRAIERAGLLGELPPKLFEERNLNRFLAGGAEVWAPVRARLTELLSDGNDEIQRVAPGALQPFDADQMRMPFEVGDYVDFYSSESHATNLGRIFRPDAEPLLPNWKHLPVGYHGRAGTVVQSGMPVRRPRGQRARGGAEAPEFGPSERLDFELEIGFVTGGFRHPLGEPIDVERAERHIFGVVLVNDWSARDIQAWEYQPLGPFLGKSFATSISPWVVPLSALEPYRVPAPRQDPPPLPYLRRGQDWTLDLSLTVGLTPARGKETIVSETNARGLYWTMSQQLAHATANGATIRPGDLFASGTISGDEPGTYGSMIELSWNGTKPVPLDDGGDRSFLLDGDTVTIRGWCGGGGRQRIGFGEVSGTIDPA